MHDWDSATGSNGVLRIYLQASKPTDPALAQNWLPVASGTDSAFNLTIRIYWPMDQALDGGWLAPAVTKLA